MIDYPNRAGLRSAALDVFATNEELERALDAIERAVFKAGVEAMAGACRRADETQGARWHNRSDFRKLLAYAHGLLAQLDKEATDA